VTPVHVERIVKFYESGETSIEQLGDLWRGRMGLTKKEQVEISPHPKVQKAISLAKSQKIAKKLEASQKRKMSSPTPHVTEKSDDAERRRSPSRGQEMRLEEPRVEEPCVGDRPERAVEEAHVTEESVRGEASQPDVPVVVADPIIPAPERKELRRVRETTATIPHFDHYWLAIVAVQLLLMALFV
jgi:hypothetical protein